MTLLLFLVVGTLWSCFRAMLCGLAKEEYLNWHFFGTVLIWPADMLYFCYCVPAAIRAYRAARVK